MTNEIPDGFEPTTWGKLSKNELGTPAGFEPTSFDAVSGGENRSALGEMGTAFKRGTLGVLLQNVGQAMQWAAPDSGSAIGDLGASISKNREEYLGRPENQLHPEKHNVVTNTLASGAEMLPVSVVPAAVAAGAVAALPGVAATGAAGLGLAALGGAAPIAMAQAQQTKEAVMKDNPTAGEAVANAAGWKSGAIELIGETLGTYIGGKFLGFGKKVLGKTASNSIGGVINDATDSSIIKPFSKELVKTAIGETATEMGQNYGEAVVEKNAGVNTDPVQQAKDSILPTIGMTLWLAPFGLSHSIKQGKHAQAVSEILDRPESADPSVRAGVVDSLYQEAVAQKIPGAEVWRAGAMEDVNSGVPIRREATSTPPEVQAEPTGIIARAAAKAGPGFTMRPSENPPTGETTQGVQFSGYPDSTDVGPRQEQSAATVAPASDYGSPANTADLLDEMSNSHVQVQQQADARARQYRFDKVQAANAQVQAERQRLNLSPEESMTLAYMRSSGPMAPPVGANTREAVRSLANKGVVVFDEKAGTFSARPLDQAAPFEPSRPAVNPAEQAANTIVNTPPTPAMAAADKRAGRAEDLKTAFSDPNALLPRHLVDAVAKMENDLKQGDTNGLIVSGQGNNKEVIGGFPSTNPNWFKNESVKAFDAENGTDYAKSVNRATITGALAKVRAGQSLDSNKAEQKAWQYIQRVAETEATTDPELVANREYTKLEKEGFQFEKPQKVAVGNLQKGDEVVVLGRNGIPDKLVHQGRDADGNIILQDGKRMSVDEFDQVEVIARKANDKKADGGVQQGTQYSGSESGRSQGIRAGSNQLLPNSANGGTAERRSQTVSGVETERPIKAQPLTSEKSNGKIQTEGQRQREGRLLNPPDSAPVVTSAGAKSVVKGQEVAVPTEAQAEAGNYKKAHVVLDGMDISIENPAGSTRSGVDQSGKKWSTKMATDYGYFKRSVGYDKDHVDVFVAPGYKGGAKEVYIVNQHHANGKFDEHKTILGATSEKEAMDIYNSNYEKGWNGGKSVVRMPIDEFKKWVRSDKPKDGRVRYSISSKEDVQKIASKVDPGIEYQPREVPGSGPYDFITSRKLNFSTNDPTEKGIREAFNKINDNFDKGEKRLPGESAGDYADRVLAKKNERVGADPPTTESKKVQKGIEGKSLLDATQFLIDTAPNKAYKIIASKAAETIRALAAGGVKFDLKIVHLGDKIPAALSSARGIAFSEFRKSPAVVTVWLNGADVTGKVGTGYETALHEIIHAATQAGVFIGERRISDGTPLQRSVTRLSDVTNIIIRHFNDRVNSGNQLNAFEEAIFKGRNNALNDKYEIISWALTNKDMQAYLETIPVNSTSTLWSEFVKAVRVFLGLSRTSDTALSEVLRVSEEIMNAPVKQITESLRTLSGATTTQATSSQMVSTQTNNESLKELSRPQRAIVNALQRSGKLKVLTAQDNLQTQGYFQDGVSYIIPENVASGSLWGVVRHEVAVHASMLLQSNIGFKNLLNSIEARRNDQTATGAAIRAAEARIPDSTRAADRAEERLAYMVEMAPESGPVRRFIVMLKNVLVKMGISPRLFSAADLGALADITLRREARVGGLSGIGEFAQPVMMSAREAAQSIYSKLDKVASLNFTGMKAQGVLNFLSKQGVKKAEIEATGLDAFIASKKPTDKVTREEFSDFVRANMVEVEDVILGGDRWAQIQAIQDKKDVYEDKVREVVGYLNDDSLLDIYAGRKETYKGTEKELRDYLDAKNTPIEGNTSFSDYQEPGADPGSYREMFVTAPSVKLDLSSAKDFFGIEDGVWNKLSADEKKSYFDEMTDHKEGGKGWQDGHSQYDDITNPIVRIRFNTETRDGSTYMRIEEMQGPSDANQSKMPSYLKENIYQIGVKRAIAYAKEQGFDGITFATREGRSAGETQADRYSLEKQMLEVKVRLDNDIAGMYQVKGYDNNGDEVLSSSVGTEDLPSYVGKDLARKIIEDIPDTGNNAPSRKYKTYTGVDLKIGGEGLKQLYDVQLPKMLEAYSKEKMVDGVLPITDKVPGSYPLFSVKNTKAQEEAIAAAFGKPKTAKERFNEFKKDWQKNIIQGVFDQYAPLTDISPTAYMQARMTKGGDSSLEAIMMYGRPVYANGALKVEFNQVNKGMNGFASVLAKLDGEHDRFFKWVAALRADSLKQIGLENLMSEDTISALLTLTDGNLQNGKPRLAAYQEALRGLNSYNNAVLKIATERGLISDETRKMYQDTPYVPFYRLTDEGAVNGFTAGSGMVNQYAWKKLKGGTAKLNEDLLANTLKNWSHLITASARNEAAKTAIEAAVKAGIAQEVPSGYPGKGVVSFHDNVTTEMKNGVRVEKFIPAGKTYFEDGVEKVSDGTVQQEVNSERTFIISDPHILDAITSLGQTVQVPAVMKAFKHFLTVGVTMNPAFKIRNLIRDSIQSMSLDDMSYNPAKNVVRGFKMAKLNSEARAQLLASGGIIRFGAMLDGTNADNARELVEKMGVPRDHILDTSGKVVKFWKHTIKPAFDAYQEFGDRGEQVNRLALYDNLLKKGYSDLEASFWARDLMDFSMSGKWNAVRFLTQTVPFLNARLQGLYKLGKSTRKDKRRVGYVVGGIALASLALLGAYGDDDDWKKREDWDRDNYWWFKIGGVAFRIPKPFELGAIGTIAERGAELMFDNEMTGKRFGERLANIVSQQLSMNPTPQFVKPLIDLWANKDSFTGRAIESMGMERLRPSDRYNERTSGIARFLGSIGLPNPSQLINANYEAMSPVQIDFLIRGYFSWLGVMSTAAMDYGIFKPLSNSWETPTRQLKDTFFVGNFVESLPSGSSRYVTRLYDQAKEIEQAYSSYHNALKLHDSKKASSILANESDKIRKYQSVEAVKRMESQLSTRVNLINADKTMTGDAKRTAIDEINTRRDKIARLLK